MTSLEAEAGEEEWACFKSFGSRTGTTVLEEGFLCTPTTSYQPPVDMLDERFFKLSWANSDEDRDAFEKEFVSIPTAIMDAPEPRSSRGDAWRDKIRDLYDFGRLK